MSAIEAVAAVIAVEEGAKHRVILPQRPGVTYFSENDVWLFDATLDGKVCPVCRAADQISQFRGNNLRMNFPYLEIIDENTIYPNVHPNCRCVLKRVIGKVMKV